MRSWRMSEKKGVFEVFAQVEVVGTDLVVILWGGTKPHIGAVGLAEPRPSLREKKMISATSSVFTFLGHKEDAVAKGMAEELARKLDRKVVVAAGMHWEELEDNEIEEIMKICERLRDKILQEIGRL